MSRPATLWTSDFFLLLQGQFVSSTGMNFSQMALILWLFEATSSSGCIGLLLMLAAIPSVLIGPVAGVVVDRFPRKHVIVACDFLQASNSLILATAIYYAQVTEWLITGVLAIKSIEAIINIFFLSAVYACIPQMVPSQKVQAANSLHSSVNEAARAFGKGIGGWFFLSIRRASGYSDRCLYLLLLSLK